MGLDDNRKRLIKHIGLFLITLTTTTLAGLEWTVGKFLISGITWSDFLFGLQFSVPFLMILTVHEFGHYFTARYHKIKVSLPYYIPFWLGFIGLPSIGTMGAFIRIREQIASRTNYFDVGVSGPVAGFVVAIICLIVGFQTLPETDYIYEIHPEYEVFGENFEEQMAGLDTILFKRDLNPERMNYVTTSSLVDTSIESLSLFLIQMAAYLYFLFICAFSIFKDSKTRFLFVTVLFTAQFFAASIFDVEGYSGWLLFSLFIGKFIGVDHPPVMENKPLSRGRKLLGWLALIIFVLSFSPQPLVINGL